MASRALVLPALGVAMLPKCPMCVMLVLGALGLGHRLHDAVFVGLQAAALVGVASLLAVRHRRAPALLALGAAGACGVLLVLAGLAAAPAGYAGAVLLAAAWLVKPEGRTTPACGCAGTRSAAFEADLPA